MFDPGAARQSIKNMMVVDDINHEAVAVVPECVLKSKQLLGLQKLLVYNSDLR